MLPGISPRPVGGLAGARWRASTPQLPANTRFLPLPVVRALHLTPDVLGFEARTMVLSWQALIIFGASEVTDLVHLRRKTTDLNAIYPLKTAVRRHGLACPLVFVLC